MLASLLSFDATLLFILTLLVAGWILRVSRNVNGQPSPPGPLGLPIVGSLLSLNPKKPYESLQKLVSKYGPVYQLKLGQVRAIVLAREDIIRTTFNQEAASGKAPLYLTHGIMKGRGVICAEGELWKEHRKFMVGVMRTLGMKGCRARDKLEQKVQETALQIAKDIGHPSRPSLVNPSPLLLHNIGNIMNLLIFGITYSKNDPVWLRLQQLLEEGTKLIGVAGAINFLPWLRILPHYANTLKFLLENQVKSHQVYQDIIEHFQASQKTDGEQKPANQEPQHFMEAYLKERDARGPGAEGSFTLSQFHYLAADVFGAGTETAHTTMRWLLLDLAQHQQKQDQVYEEIRELAEGRGFISMDDMTSLVYTQAFLMESQRSHPAVPLGAPHGTLTEMVISGYKVSKGTMLIPLLSEVLQNEDDWHEPKQFKPERFIEKGKLLKPAPFIPFQIGRRMCPGEEYARMALLLFMTQILLHYKILLPTQYRDMALNSSKKQSENIQADQVEDPPNKESDCLDWKIVEGSSHFDEVLSQCCREEDPFADPICGFTAVPRPYRLVLIPRN